MNWGDTRRWVWSLPWTNFGAVLAVLLATAALIVSIRAQRDGRRSANAAEESVKEARRSGDAAVRSAVAAELTLADQQRAAEEQRAAEAEANRPRPALSIEHSRKAVWQLINTAPQLRGRFVAPSYPLRWRVGWKARSHLSRGR